MHNRGLITHMTLAVSIAGFLAAGGNVSAQAPAKPAAERTATEKNPTILAAQILTRWAPIAQAAGADLSMWQEQFATQFKLMSLGNLLTFDRLQVNADASAATNYARFAQVFRNVMTNAYMEEAAAKGNLKLGSTTTDQVFIPITPCRVVDTRSIGGPISFGTARNFNFYAGTAGFNWGSQGGPSGVASTTCPGTVNPNGGAPSAAAATITVVSPSDAGNFVAWGGVSPVPLTSVLNWRNAGDITANTTIIPAGGRVGTGPGGPIADFAIYYNGSSGVAQVVVDVVGYFVENKATALDCVYPSVAGAGAIVTGDRFRVVLPGCPTGYVKTGAGCFSDFFPGNAPLLEASLSSSNDCYWANNTGGDLSGSNFHAETACCRVPGL